MIPVSVSPETREGFVRNIIAEWNSATTEQQQRGRTWYRTAHELASAMTSGDSRAGAGVLAALSANKSWAETLRLARQACETGLYSGHFSDALNKVARILAGTDPTEVLPMDRKTGHFFQLIAEPNDPNVVVVDRHAHDIAVGETYGQRDRGLSSARRYDLLADCYREAARRLGELPSTVQAVTWVARTERLSGVDGSPSGLRAA
ncbi:hypothetical protein OHT76_05555 [Streptomyces sp. NBC_00287]|uniref:DUF7178 family protein n=1 Tax=Streptomyces sp. NBC_00287 TaxID=2975702 RepID=UPI002E28AAAD|nr:hypothetical protein [Streptomyces sp. NBC_00287]